MCGFESEQIKIFVDDDELKKYFYDILNLFLGLIFIVKKINKNESEDEK